MYHKAVLTISRIALVIFVVILSASPARAAHEKVLHNFGSGDDGAYPRGGLVFDAAGNLYGTASDGGTDGFGTVFEMTPNGNGGWTERTLHNFRGGMSYGTLVFDNAGNLFGVNDQGGTHGNGIAFEMIPDGSGVWTPKVLHNFGSGSDAALPTGPTLDADGNLYGTAWFGGSHGTGTVWKITPNGSGGWTEKTLHNFELYPGDGFYPTSPVIFDAAGNLYGTTYMGGTHNAGTVFEMMPREDGGWTEKVLHNFGSGQDGVNPTSSLVFDAAGNLYGTTYYGGHDSPSVCEDMYGDSGCGVVFELSSRQDGGWTEKVLHFFNKDWITDGTHPNGPLIFDAAGNLYGTASGWGCRGCGTVFELIPGNDGRWTTKVLHRFGRGDDGIAPMSGLIFDAAGNLYGTTAAGGTYDKGTVFEITP